MRQFSVVYFVLGLLAMPAVAQPPPGMVDAALAGDWKRVLNNASSAADGPSKHIAGHAYLATNKGNEAACAFIVAAADDGQQAWLTWSRDLAARMPRSATAAYFVGDALARRNMWPAARMAFDDALRLDPRHSLALNARAWTRAAAGEWDAARTDLRAAEAARPTLLDATVSKGVLAVLKRQDPLAVAAAFDTALKVDPLHGIALNGRGAAEAADKHWDAAREYYNRAAAAAPCLPLTLENLLLVEEADLAEARKVAERLVLAGPGSTAESKFLQANKLREKSLAEFKSTTVTAEKVVGNITLAEKIFAGMIRISGDTWKDTMDDAKKGKVTGLDIGLNILKNIGSRIFNMASSAVEKDRKNYNDQMRSLKSNYGALSSRTFERPPIGGMSTETPSSATDIGDWPAVIWPTLVYEIPVVR